MADEKQMDPERVIPEQAREKAQDSVKQARKAADDIGSTARAIAEDYRGKAEQAWDDAKDRIQTFRKDADVYVRKNPLKAVFTALGIGFVLGVIFRR
jgi:ElaB/YqjD/DUF883 family membrane-anchored ribosome-binding protein